MNLLDKKRAETSNRRRAVVAAVDAMITNGMSEASACRELNLSQATIARWRKQPVPQTANCGRKSVVDKFGDELSNDALLKLKELRLKTGSAVSALLIFADDPLCPPGLAAEILKNRASVQNMPMSLKRLTYVTPEMEAMFRGERTYALSAFTQLRDNTEEMPDGSRRIILPGDWWELDDMSFNQPFWYDNPDGADPLAKRFGVGIGRQSLWAMDCACGKLLGFELVGRPRDAYRAEDILRFLRHLFQTWGLPRRGLRLERGIWRSKKIRGIEIADFGPEYGEEFNRPGMAEEEKQKVFGALTELGIEIRWVWSPNTKGLIEGGFDHFQTIMGVV